MEQKPDPTPEDAMVDQLQRVVGALEADDRVGEQRRTH